MIKLQIKVGTSEIQLEGKIEDVELILSKHWEPYVDAIISTPPPQPIEVRGTDKPSATPKPRKGKATRAKHKATSENGKDYQELTNIIKEHAKFDALMSKAINANASAIDRYKGVLFALDRELSAVDIANVLTELGVKADRSNILKSLNKQTSSFFKNGSNPVCFRMTQKAKDDFTAWLSEDDA
ncbi:hypothetical protein OU789_11100 [Halocynthiibacter sp. C4]|uniref:hypothetical protein n=1 Tax=Halocynthiibacter sp. C4 TaxID=2992758 RepID=UPI00237A846E|nr:hypothetical protein [Halocynthiibacter sp. C4]MDE0590474.1 hypothetical protein [Halocynthiibacter sp. C4]